MLLPIKNVGPSDRLSSFARLPVPPDALRSVAANDRAVSGLRACRDNRTSRPRRFPASAPSIVASRDATMVRRHRVQTRIMVLASRQLSVNRRNDSQFMQICADYFCRRNCAFHICESCGLRTIISARSMTCSFSIRYTAGRAAMARSITTRPTADCIGPASPRPAAQPWARSFSPTCSTAGQ